jgi:dDENN domain
MDPNEFRSNDFLTYCAFNVSYHAVPFIQSMIGTQMFQAFIDERRAFPNEAEVLFFDESIMAKQNRSAKKAISNITAGRTVKKQTSFLNDKTSVVR